MLKDFLLPVNSGLMVFDEKKTEAQKMCLSMADAK